MRAVLRAIDSVSQQVGSAARWFTVALVAVAAFDTLMRYAFNAPTVWAYETCCMLGGGTYALGWAYAHLRKSHIRVDVFYTRYSPWGKVLSDVICAAFFFFPLMAILTWKSVFWAVRAWRIDEVMIETYWYPPAAPFRTVIALGICLFFLQGSAQFVRDLYFVIRRKAID
jgi:TRAP-type mannitol/chloroaromatic compound transport system permease small subunit